MTYLLLGFRRWFCSMLLTGYTTMQPPAKCNGQPDLAQKPGKNIEWKQPSPLFSILAKFFNRGKFQKFKSRKRIKEKLVWISEKTNVVNIHNSKNIIATFKGGSQNYKVAILDIR